MLAGRVLLTATCVIYAYYTFWVLITVRTANWGRQRRLEAPSGLLKTCLRTAQLQRQQSASCSSSSIGRNAWVALRKKRSALGPRRRWLARSLTAPSPNQATPRGCR